MTADRNTVYVSIPDPTATTTLGDQCQGLGLLSLPTAYTYHCAASSTFRMNDGRSEYRLCLHPGPYGYHDSRRPMPGIRPPFPSYGIYLPLRGFKHLPYE